MLSWQHLANVGMPTQASSLKRNVALDVGQRVGMALA